MNPLLLLLLFVILSWLIRQVKAVLLWVYLWQLKEYHVGRFLDHFRTAKGRQLIRSDLSIAKIITLVFLLFDPIFFVLVFFLYAVELVKTGKDIASRNLLRPVFTAKTIVLVGLGLFVGILLPLSIAQTTDAIHRFLFWLLLFDVLVPVFVSSIVLLLQPITVVRRGQIIQRARTRMKTFQDLTVVGITGSYGKTTTKELLSHVLGEKFQVLKTPDHQNSEVGISRTILRLLTDVHDVFVCEMGAYNKGGIELLSYIAQPKIAVVAGVNEQHLATFGTMNNLLSAEGGEELIRALPKDGVAILNADSELLKGQEKKLQSINRKIKKMVWCSANPIRTNGRSGRPTSNGAGIKADYWAESIRVNKEYISFEAFSKHGESAHFKVNVLGAHHAVNILLAAAAASELGMKLAETAQALKTVGSEASPMKLIKGVGGVNIVDATYSANPDGVIAALEYLKIWQGRRVIVMPCLIELGAASSEVHNRIGEKIAEVCDFAIITTRECFVGVEEGAVKKGMHEDDILYSGNPDEIFKKLQSFCNDVDVILLESRVPKRLIDLLFQK